MELYRNLWTDLTLAASKNCMYAAILDCFRWHSKSYHFGLFQMAFKKLLFWTVSDGIQKATGCQEHTAEPRCRSAGQGRGKAGIRRMEGATWTSIGCDTGTVHHLFLPNHGSVQRFVSSSLGGSNRQTNTIHHLYLWRSWNTLPPYLLLLLTTCEPSHSLRSSNKRLLSLVSVPEQTPNLLANIPSSSKPWLSRTLFQPTLTFTTLTFSIHWRKKNPSEQDKLSWCKWWCKSDDDSNCYVIVFDLIVRAESKHFTKHNTLRNWDIYCQHQVNNNIHQYTLDPVIIFWVLRIKDMFAACVSVLSYIFHIIKASVHSTMCLTSGKHRNDHWMTPNNNYNGLAASS